MVREQVTVICHPGYVFFFHCLYEHTWRRVQECHVSIIVLIGNFNELVCLLKIVKGIHVAKVVTKHNQDILLIRVEVRYLLHMVHQSAHFKHRVVTKERSVVLHYFVTIARPFNVVVEHSTWTIVVGPGLIRQNFFIIAKMSGEWFPDKGELALLGIG